MGYEIEFYRTESGRSPVEEFLKSLPMKQSAKISRDIGLLKNSGASERRGYESGESRPAPCVPEENGQDPEKRT